MDSGDKSGFSLGREQESLFFLSFFFVFYCGPFLKSLLDLVSIASFVCFGSLAMRHVRSYLPDLGGKPSPALEG